MAKSKRSRSATACTNQSKPCHGRVAKPVSCNNSAITQDAIDRHWAAFPPQAKSFILGTNDGMFSLRDLVQFWSSPNNVECTRGGIAGSICGAAWYLALVHLHRGMYKEARALTANGAFIHQCYISSIEEIKEVIGSCHLTHELLESRLPYFVRGCKTVRSPQEMERYITSYLPKEYTSMMTCFANLSNSSSMKGYVNQISDDWKSASTPKKNQQHGTDGAKIEIILVDNANNEQERFDIGSSTTLKSLFNEYADKRGVSLRSLRFSYGGKTLFLSSAGHKTPEELSWRDGDIISVHDTTESSDDETSCPTSAAMASSASKKKTKKRPNKKVKGKNKKSQQHYKPTKTLGENKVEHSLQLTKVHDEAQHQFKSIRQRLNNLVIERSQPKTRRPRAIKQETPKPSMVTTNPLKEGLGGKAGKSHYVIQVGEVQNLYKTTKPSTMHECSSTPMSTLDLHGCTRGEALVKLNESRNSWFDDAMKGSYPFVKTAVIVCGCGSQTLSETVQEWIKTNDKVSNAPQIKSSRRRGFASKAA